MAESRNKDIMEALTNAFINGTISSTGTLNILQDTTPQLGGQLDVNGNAIGDGSLELLKFSETASAVNELTIANAATGSGPTLSATGDDTNVDINLTPKGSGDVVITDGTHDLNIASHDDGTNGLMLGGTLVTSSATELNLLDGVTGTLVTEAGTQTLTNKTLTTPVISSISNTGTLTLPTSTDTLVGRATTDTLTNKTLTTPVISSISNTGTLTLPTSTDTLVGRATTDTLTNKTLTSPTVGTNLDLSARAPVQFYDSDSSNYIGIRAPSTVASNVTFTLPSADGTADQVLKTDGAGNLSFVAAGGGSGGFTDSTVTTHPAAAGDDDLADGETPFDAATADAFGVNLGSVYDHMEPVGSTTTIDLGDGEDNVGA